MNYTREDVDKILEASGHEENRSRSFPEWEALTEKHVLAEEVKRLRAELAEAIQNARARDYLDSF